MNGNGLWRLDIYEILLDIPVDYTVHISFGAKDLLRVFPCRNPRQIPMMREAEGPQKLLLRVIGFPWLQKNLGSFSGYANKHVIWKGPISGSYRIVVVVESNQFC